MHADFVGLRGKPGQIQPLGALLPGANAVLPVEAGYEIAAGIAHQRDAQLAHQLDNILAKTLLIRLGMTRLIDAAVHRPARCSMKEP